MPDYRDRSNIKKTTMEVTEDLNPEIATLLSVSSTFPILPSPLIKRQNLLQALHDMLADNEVVAVDGPEGVGKTTLLAEFATLHPNAAFSLFVSGASSYTYDCNMLSGDLSKQIGWALDRQNFNDEDSEDAPQILHSRIMALQRQANIEKKTYYFIIDGLHEIPEEDSNALEMLIKILPFGLTRFRFLISGPSSMLSRRKVRPHNISPLRVIGFSLEDTEKFFKGVVEDRSLIESIHQLSKTIPGNMAVLRRIITGGTAAETLLDNISKNPPDWLELEWKIVEGSPQYSQQTLAALAYYRGNLVLGSLAEIFNVGVQELQESLQPFTFIEIKEDGKVDFIGEGFRRLASAKLTRIKKTTMDSIISHLMATPNSQQSIDYLPGILHQAGKHEDLVSFLSHSAIDHVISNCESWVPLHQKLKLALAAAGKVENDSEMLRFGIQNASLLALESSDPWLQEIHAYVALGDFSAISVIAQKLPTIEDRLHLLCIIARSRKANALPVDPEINEQISSIYKMVDVGSLGPRGLEIASDLLYVNPELAIELVQNCGAEHGAEKNTDIAFAQMSISALLDKSGGMEATHQDLKDRIKDPNIQKYVNTLGMHIGSFSPEALFAEIKNWEKPHDRIVALKGWMIRNKKNQNSKIVISYALDTILKTTAFTANAGVYAQIALPLPHLEDSAFVREIIVRIDGIKGTIEQAGPTTEYVRLQCLLAEGEYKYNRQSAFNRLQELLFYVDKIADRSTGMECFAILVSALKAIDPEQHFSAQEPIFDLAVDGLHVSAKEILEKAADHFAAIRPAIWILATTQPLLAFDVIGKLNTIRRRDKAFAELVRAIARETFSENNLDVVFSAFDRIECQLIRASSIQASLRTLFENPENVGKFSHPIIKFYQKLELLGSPAAKSPSYARMLAIIDRDKISCGPELRESISKRILDEWSAIITGWDKVRVGFKIVQILSKDSPDMARDILGKTEDVRGQVIFDSLSSARSYIGCVRLAIRALAGLVKRKEYREDDLEVIRGLIERIPCPVNQIALWGEMAMRFHIQGDHSKCVELANKIIKPAIAKQFSDDVDAYNTVVMTVASALHCAHPPSAIQLIKALPATYSDSAFGDICDFIVKSRVPFEDYDDNSKCKEMVTYEKFLDVISILDLFASDWRLCDAIEALVDGIGPKRFRTQFNRGQIADVNARLNSIISTKFPNAQYIQHDGYKLIAESLLLRLNGSKDGWVDLLNRARALPNFADATLVLISVSAKLPAREKVLALATFSEAKSRIPLIPFFEDRLHHLEHLAKCSLDVDKEFSKECIRGAWRESMPLDQTDLPQARNRLIDFAHRIDPEFASSLASEIGEDPGRDYARSEAADRLELLKVKHELASGVHKPTSDTEDPQKSVAVAQMMLSGLNSERLSSLHLNKMRPYIDHAGKLSISDSYYIFAWVIENAVKRFSGQINAASILRPNYEAIRLVCELTFKIASRKRAVVDSGIFAARNSNWGSSLVRPGERDLGIALICEWADEAVGFIKITDPFFGLEELNLIKSIREINQDIPIHIVTSRKHQVDMGIEQPWEDAYSTYWRISVSDSDPGPVTITMIGSGSSGAHPIHDRWCLSRESGLRLGTSINSIGAMKSSEISKIEEADSRDLLGELESWLRNSKLDDRGERVKRTTFEL